MTTMMMEDDTANMGMSNATTTIDASVVQSRILQSASLAKEQDDDSMEDAQQPTFPQLSAMAARGGKTEYRRVRCPPHRYTPLRENWEQILTPLVEFLKLQASKETKCEHLSNKNAKDETCQETSAWSCSQSRFMRTNPLGSLHVVKMKWRDIFS